MTRALVLAHLALLPLAAMVAHGYHDERHLDAPDPSAEVLVIGASVTYRWPERAPGSWLATFGPQAQHLGSPGMQTRHALADLPLQTDARLIVVDLGGCDVRHGASPLDAAQGVASIVESLLATTDAQILVLAQVDPWAVDVNLWTQHLVSDFPRTTFVPLPEVELLPDGKHPTRRGYERIASAVSEVRP